MAHRVLVIGSGGREHALAWKLAQSPHIKHVFVAPGNAGTAASGKISNSAVLVSNHTIVTQFCKDHNIGLVLVGEEALLAAGIVDDLRAAGVGCFGPCAKAAQLASKPSLSKAFLARHGMPTARWGAFRSAQEACRFIISSEFPGWVLRAHGPSARTEVTIATSKEDACRAAQEVMQDRMFGEMVVIEELLQGEELSCSCFTDGATVVPTPPAQAHKRLLEGDQGPTTAGMGAYCPVPQVPEALLEQIQGEILQRIVDGLRQEGTAYVGVLQTSLMLTKEGVKILNFKCQFGDPQCQAILALLETDLYEMLEAALKGQLCHTVPTWHQGTAVCVVMASQGYPRQHSTGHEVTGLPQAQALGLQVFHGGTALKDGRVVTTGGRVLSITAVREDLLEALGDANRGVATIHFQGATYRRDIGHRGLRLLQQPLALMYRERRVEATTRDVLPHLPQAPVVSGTRAGSRSALGGSAGFFDLKASGYDDPILVAQTKDLGTKLQIAQVCKRHDTIGQDLVALCANALLAQGAEPLFFLSHFACGKLDAEVTETLQEGIAEACRSAGCAFLGREVSEVPGWFPTGEFALSGFVVGAVERGQELLGLQRAEEGDVLLGLACPAIHGRGVGAVQRVLLASPLQPCSPAPGSAGHTTLGEALLSPARMYSPSLLPVLRSGHVKAFAPIAEEGLVGGIARILPEHLSAILDALSWKIPEIFCWLYKEGNLSAEEMAQTFPCGIGAVLLVQQDLAQHVLRTICRQEQAWPIGRVVSPGHTGAHVEVQNLEAALQLSSPQGSLSDGAPEARPQPARRRVRVAVLVSGTGTTLSALMGDTREPGSRAQLVLLISSRAGVEELRNAARAGIPTRVIDPKLFGSRAEFDSTLDHVLEEFSVELICLAGFVRVLSSPFLRKWRGKILSASPSLLPLVKDGNAPQEPPQGGFKVTGCTVHFVLEPPGPGPAIHREPVAVRAGDSAELLSERVRDAESRALPTALQLVASGAVSLAPDGTVCWKRESRGAALPGDKGGCESCPTAAPEPQERDGLRTGQ
ncbi:trifunctional purine biosynthetic protein adenosine-3-like [Pithys albifrons albifrons]|uniref:trifunctional purine biosynthetic protein adenosine-3-like n=1 Tax=Pithys albifrons albifrons TaxID=3385563 RepID=UPI003A5CD22D